jgi:multicomponent Na+:H+ antiporter subunit A
MARWIARLLPWILALPPALLAFYFGRAGLLKPEGTALEFHAAWVPALGLSWDFSADALSCLFAALVCGIGSCVVLFSGAYLKGHPRLGRYYGALFFFMVAMLGTVLADHLIALFVFWELTGLGSFLLIGFEQENVAARKSALQALLVTSLGGLLMLVGFLLLGQAAETYVLSEIVARAPQIQSDYFFTGFAVLILIGIFAKSAQFPFHFWLPSAMAAPTPVSAHLHSATLVKAGLYLAARLSPAFAGTLLWDRALLFVGGLTVLIACVQGLAQRDLKRILACSTLGALGLLFVLLGAGLHIAFLAFLLAHALYKSALFLVAGVVDHQSGSRDARLLGRLLSGLPITAAAAGLAALAMAALPPSLAYLAKESALPQLYEGGFRWELLLTCLASAFFTAVALIVGLRLFWLKPVEAGFSVADTQEGSLLLWGPPVLLAFFGIGVGLMHKPLAARLLDAAASVVAGDLADSDLHFWAGFGPGFFLSLASWIAGLALFLAWPRMQPALARLVDYVPGPSSLYDFAIEALPRYAGRGFDLLQNGSLPRYVACTLAFAAALLAWPFMAGERVTVWVPDWNGVHAYEYLLCAALLAGAGLSVSARDSLRALVATGIIGFSVACAYVFYGAPDLALTQILVESISLLLVLLVFARLPRNFVPAGRRRSAFAALLAGSLGFLLGFILWIGAENPLFDSISAYFSEQSLPAGHGRNIVNVILVDFRGWDTMGEITVLAIAALGVHALLKLGRGRKEA